MLVKVKVQSCARERMRIVLAGAHHGNARSEDSRTFKTAAETLRSGFQSQRTLRLELGKTLFSDKRLLLLLFKYFGAILFILIHALCI